VLYELRRLRRGWRTLVVERFFLKKAAVESTAQRNTLREDISGRLEAQGLSWTLQEQTRPKLGREAPEPHEDHNDPPGIEY
jgi:hypothetical protein